MSYLSLTASSGAALQNWQEAWGAECRPPWHICLDYRTAALGLLHEGIVLDAAAGLVTSQGKTLGNSQPYNVLRRKGEKGTCAREAKTAVGRHVCINKTNCPAWQWLWFCCLHLFFPGYPSLQCSTTSFKKAAEQTSSNRRNFSKCLSHASGRIARHNLDTGSKDLAAQLGSWQAQQQHLLLPKGSCRNSSPDSAQDVREHPQ